MKSSIAELIPDAAEFIAIRHDIHRNPELAFEEVRTSKLVAEKLRGWGYAVNVGLGGTGVVGQLKKGSSKKTIGLRADMDALPILEANTFGHASTIAGKMHACGHDGHTAMLLAAAKHIVHADFDGTINLIFQPAEEGRGGAKKMMDDGLFEQFPCDMIFAIHNMPTERQGTLQMRDGPAMASSDRVKITLMGKGGHAAMPQFASDSIVAGSSIVMALQTIVARNVDPQKTAVVTVGTFHAGTVSNIIPGRVEIELSVRALDRETRDLLENRITSIVHAQAESFGVKAEIDYHRHYPVLVNWKEPTDIVREVARDLVGVENTVPDVLPVTGSEDFAFMLEKVPGCYLFIGNGDEPGACMVHNPGYDFNDSNIPVGAAFWVALTKRCLR